LSEPTNYEYDVFLSYKHGALYGAWVEFTFLPLFRELLKEELLKPPKVFFDRSGISPADAFPSKLKRALATSRCMVAVWTPSYFYDSPWCRMELTLMLLRETKLRRTTVVNPAGLIAPITLHDGRSFPDEVRKNRNPVDWSAFAYDGDGFKQTVEYVRFQQALKAWVPQVAALVKSAPDWENGWLKQPLPAPKLILRKLGKKPRTNSAPVLT
jgi:hypothetical protein